jgi:hypothetical protein
MDVLFFYVGLVSLPSHIALCLLLQRSLRENWPALHELFATPNERVVGPSRFKLLRGRYYFWWRPVPGNVPALSGGQLALLNLARTTGLLVAVGFLGFIGVAFIQATK